MPSLSESAAPAIESDLVPLPSSGSAIPAFRTPTPLTQLICDERAISALLRTLLNRAGLSNGEAARRLGVNYNSVSQYLNGRRNRPSLLWFLKFVDLCGARLLIEFPAGKR